MPPGSLNDYSNFIRLENSLLLANDRIKSLESLLASKDFIIYHMSMCNALMAQSPKASAWRPPLPPNPPIISKEGFNAADGNSQCPMSNTDCLQGKSKSAALKGHSPNQVSPSEGNSAGDFKSKSKSAALKAVAELFRAASGPKTKAFVESQMREGGGGVSTNHRPQKPSFTSSLSVKGHSLIDLDQAAALAAADFKLASELKSAADQKSFANIKAADDLEASADLKAAADSKLAADVQKAKDLKVAEDSRLESTKADMAAAEFRAAFKAPPGLKAAAESHANAVTKAASASKFRAAAVTKAGTVTMVVADNQADVKELAVAESFISVEINGKW